MAQAGRPVDAFVVLGVLLASLWTVNLGVVLRFGNDQELYPMSTYPMFSSQRETEADDYRWHVVPADGGEPVEMSGLEMWSAEHAIKPWDGRKIHRQVLQSVDLGCEDIRDRTFCSRDPQSWRVPEDYGRLWAGVAAERLGLGHPPASMTFLQVVVPVDGGQAGDQVERPIFRYEPATGNTTVLSPDPLPSRGGAP